ncbi:STAS domain-containing protein [Magnetococcus sp. PR-3]|uniref:STAS domain-containing protein n=1 Tax=Magnetococcus sp. PR-3 TaxID=3120355 RepID=UPI002FCE3C5F
MFQLSADGANATLTLDGDLTIQQAAELKESCVNAVQNSENLALNISGVTRVDLAGIQLICAMHRALVDGGKHLTIQGEVPEAFRETVRIAGFQACVASDQTQLWNAGE